MTTTPPITTQGDLGGIVGGSPQSQSFIIKTVVTGRYSVGKTSLLISLKNPPSSTQEAILSVEPTVGGSLVLFTTPRGKDTITLHIWDTAGTERYKSVAPIYYKGAVAAAIVFDAADPSSYDDGLSWLNHCVEGVSDSCVFVIVANKCDLIVDRSCCPVLNKAREFSKQRGYGFFETSAKTGENVNAVFEYIVDKLYTSFKMEVKSKISIENGDDQLDHLPSSSCGIC